MAAVAASWTRASSSSVMQAYWPVPASVMATNSSGSMAAMLSNPDWRRATNLGVVLGEFDDDRLGTHRKGRRGPSGCPGRGSRGWSLHRMQWPAWLPMVIATRGVADEDGLQSDPARGRSWTQASSSFREKVNDVGAGCRGIAVHACPEGDGEGLLLGAGQAVVDTRRCSRGFRRLVPSPAPLPFEAHADEDGVRVFQAQGIDDALAGGGFPSAGLRPRGRRRSLARCSRVRGSRRGTLAWEMSPAKAPMGVTLITS